MLVRDEWYPAPNGTGELFPAFPEEQVPSNAADALQSALITAFEESIDQGMNPMDALSMITGWVASEMVRIRAGEKNGSS